MRKKQYHDKCPTGVPGIDEILCGGLPRDYLFLLQGKPGTGKTTLALQFLLEGAARGERSLYITFSETKMELEAVAESHGWDIDRLDVLEFSTITGLRKESTQTTLFYPSEMELSKTIEVILQKISDVGANRVVFDSVSELRLLAETSLRYRRQMLAFKEFFLDKAATVLFLDDLTTEAGDEHVKSIVHGVMVLEKFRAAYGIDRREFHILKMRGVDFRSGTHDYMIRKGGITIFPRLVAADHLHSFTRETFASGVASLDLLLGGGLDRGTSNLILGPAGTGKSTIALQFAIAAAARGKKVAHFSFEESIDNLRFRAQTLKMELEPLLDSGALSLQKVDPAELTPGQFAALLREQTTERNIDMVVIDSLNGYIHAMPEQQFLMLQLHELFAYLGNRGTVTVMVVAQAGIMGTMRTPLDLTYLADSVIVTRFFEAFGHVKKAISVTKRRTGVHEETLRELRVGTGGVNVGQVLEEFSGIFTGVPRYNGSSAKMMNHDEK